MPNEVEHREIPTIKSTMNGMGIILSGGKVKTQTSNVEQGEIPAI